MPHQSIPALASLSIALLASCVSPGIEVSNLATLALKDVRGDTHFPLSAEGQKATVLFFVLHDCPICNLYAPEMNRLIAEYSPMGIRSYIVYVEAGFSADLAGKHAKDHGFTCPALLDPEQRLAGFTQATIAPEVAVVSPDRVILYRGRIDDRVIAPGRVRLQPTQRDLKIALDSILENKPVLKPITKPVGCYIENFKDTKRHEK